MGRGRRAIDWYEPPRRCSTRMPASTAAGSPAARCNTCYNAVDRHVSRGRGEQAALIYDSPVTGTKQTHHLRASCRPRSQAAGRRSCGISASRKGDRVILYMPMVPEAVIGMLACARLGAVHSVVFGGFAANELATRIDDATPEGDPVGLLRHRAGPRRPLQAAARPGDRARRRTSPRRASSCSGRSARRRSSPAATTTGRRVWAMRSLRAKSATTACRSPPPTRSISSTRRARPAGPRAWCATTAATWSRSTGRCNTSTASSRARCGGPPPTSAGWSGHCYIVYAPLLHGCTTVLYEGKPVGTPDAGAFWRVIAEHGVVALFTAPTAFRAIKKEDPQGKLLGAVRPVEVPRPVPRRRARRSRHA